MALRSIALSRGRFTLLALATLISGLALLVVSLLDLRDAAGLPLFWRLLLGLVGVAEVGMAWFYFRLVADPELLVDETHMTLPWNVVGKDRRVEWRNVARAEIAPTRLAWSDQPVLTLVGAEGHRNVEVPRGHIKDWDGLVAAVGDHLGPVTNTFT